MHFPYPVRFFVFLLFVISVPGGLRAQQPYLFRFDSTYRMHGTSCFNKVKLIDSRFNKEDIGYVRNLIPRLPQTIKTLRPFVEGFERSFIHFFDSAGERKDSTLLIVLYDFELADYPNGREVGTFHLGADYFIGNADQYRLVQHVDTLYELWDEFHVTKKLVKFAGVTFNEYIAEMAGTDASGGDARKYTEQSAIAMRDDAKKEMPIYSTKKFNKGICYTKDQFLQNAALDTPFIKIDIIGDDNINIPRYYYENAKGKKGENIASADCFAIYSGLWYLSSRDRFVILKNRRGEFYTNLVFMGIYNERYRITAMAMILSPHARGDAPMRGLFEARFDPVTRKFVRIRKL